MGRRPSLTQVELSRLSKVAKKEGVAIDIIEAGRTIRIYPTPDVDREEDDLDRELEAFKKLHGYS